MLPFPPYNCFCRLPLRKPGMGARSVDPTNTFFMTLKFSSVAKVGPELEFAVYKTHL